MTIDPPVLLKSLSPGGVLTLTFNRPSQLNAMNRALMAELIGALTASASDEATRVVVLTGAGRAFMAGADLKEYAAQSQADFDAFQNTGRSLYAAIENNPKPVLAAINGHCFGGGFEIALACDLLLAAAEAKCGLPEIKLALIPGGGGTLRLAQRAGLGRALDVAMTGRTVQAEELLDWGVINRVFAKETFQSQVTDFAESLASSEPGPLRALKQLARRACPPPAPELIAMEGEALGRFFAGPAARAKIAEFAARSAARKQSSGS